MGKGFSSSDFLYGSDDSVNGYPYVDAFGNPDNIVAPDWLTSIFSTDSDLEPGLATAIALGDGFDPKLHLYDSTGLTYFKINDPVADDDAFGGTDSQSVFYAFPGATYDAVVESFGVFPADESRNFYFEVQVDGAGNDLFGAQNLGDLSVNGFAFTNDFVGVSDAEDYYQFDLSTGQNIELYVGGLQGDVDVELLDAGGNFITGSFNGGTDAESITTSLSAGTYYVRTKAFYAGNQARAIASNDVASNYFLDLYVNGTTQPPRAPTDITLLNGSQPVDSIDENKLAGTVVGNFSTADPDDPNKADSYIYSLVSGTGSTDNSKFSLSSTGVLTTNQPFDYEVGPKSYTIRVQTQDSEGESYSEEFTIGVRDVIEGMPPPPPPKNQKPTDLNLSNTTLAENQPIGTTVGTLSTTDPDDPGKTGTYTYSLVPVAGNTDNNAFEIVGNQLRAKQSLDFETRNSYSLKVRTADSGGLTFDKDLKISVSDLPEPPPNPSVFTPQPSNPTDEPIVGDSKNNRLFGTAQDDLIRGRKGDDKLNGKGGNDILVGGAGNDLLRGGAGDDIFRGGQGNDTCVLNGGFDTIQSFSDGQDKLKLVGLSFGNLTITQQGSDTLVRSGSNPILLITGVNSSLITAADFV